MSKTVTQAKKKTFSKQPRFKDINAGEFFYSTFQYVKGLGQDCPPYSVNSMARDLWLSDADHLEPHLAGVLHSVSSIDANRGWTLEGGRNQVSRYTDILRGWQVAPGVKGWRPSMVAQSLGYNSTDLGWVTELGRDGKNGPVRGLYHLDPTRCQLNGDDLFPLKYTTLAGGAADWAYGDFMRGVNMINIQEKYNGLGYCAVSRCLDLMKIMVAIYEHDREQLGAQAPRGLLLLSKISQTNWDTAMEARKANLNAEGLAYFDAVAVLASETEDIDAKLVALSQLPAGFDMQKFTSLLMYGYALCFGFDASEFYPVQFGGLSQGVETEVMSEKASGKGGLNFVFTVQEQLQRPEVLPPSLDFEFDQRDEQAEIQEAAVAEAWVKVYRAMREAGLQTDMQGGITKDEMRQLLADKNLIPKEWTEVEEDVVATDEQPNVDAPAAPLTPTLTSRERRILRDDLLSRVHVQHAVERFPLQDLVRYTWPQHRMTTVWQNLGALNHRLLYPVTRAMPKDMLYQGDDFEITTQDVDRAIEQAPEDLKPLLEAL